MSRRAVLALCVIVLVAAGGAALLTRGKGDEEQAAVGDPLAEALGYAPASAELVAALEVQKGSPQGEALRELARTFPAARFGADGVRGAVRSLGFDADADLPSLLGGPVVVAGPARAVTQVAGSAAGLQLDLARVLRAGAVVAVVGRSVDDVAAVMRRAVDDGRLAKLQDIPPGVAQYRLPGAAGVLAVRDADLVLAGDAARLKEAVALRDRRGGLTRATFEQRLGPVPKPALILATAQPRALIGAAAKGVPWVDALRGGSVSVRLADPGVRVRVHLATDPRAVRPEDLPLGSAGTPAPAPAAGAAPIWAGVTNLSQTIRVLNASRDTLKVPFLHTITNALDTIDGIKGPLKTFGGIDVDAALLNQLTGTTTFTQEAQGIAMRAELQDGGPLRTALDRIAAIPDFAIDIAGITDLNVRERGDAYEVTRNGTTFLKVAVLKNTLVVTDDLHASLQAIAGRKPEHARSRGALAFHATGPAIQDQLVQRLGLPGLARLVLGGIGDLDGSARAELSGVDVDATLALED